MLLPALCKGEVGAGAREGTRGLRMTFEPKYLRFFQARFEPA